MPSSSSNALKFKPHVLPNEKAHQMPKVGKRYGHRFGSKKVNRIFHDAGVAMVEYLTYKGETAREALTMFNRWAFRNNIAIP